MMGSFSRGKVIFRRPDLKGISLKKTCEGNQNKVTQKEQRDTAGLI